MCVQAQQAQRGLNPAAMANQQASSQRLMRPVSTNNLGLRHLLQQVRTCENFYAGSLQ